MRCTGFFGEILAADIFDGVLLEWDRRKAALLGTVMNQAVFADVEVTRACSASPLVRASQRNIILEGIYSRKAALL